MHIFTYPIHHDIILNNFLKMLKCCAFDDLLKYANKTVLNKIILISKNFSVCRFRAIISHYLKYFCSNLKVKTVFLSFSSYIPNSRSNTSKQTSLIINNNLLIRRYDSLLLLFLKQCVQQRCSSNCILNIS